MLGWSAFTAVAVTILVYLLNYPLAKYDVYVRCSVGFPWAVNSNDSEIVDAPELESVRPEDEHCERAIPEHPFPQVLRLGCVYALSLPRILWFLARVLIERRGGRVPLE